MIYNATRIEPLALAAPQALTFEKDPARERYQVLLFALSGPWSRGGTALQMGKRGRRGLLSQSPRRREASHETAQFSGSGGRLRHVHSGRRPESAGCRHKTKKRGRASI